MIDRIPFTGGCLCGALRYEVRGAAAETTVCHCSDCRRASGAPFVAWTFFQSGSLSWLHGIPKLLRFAERERSFCGDCGTPLIFFDPATPEWFEVNTCTFDKPEFHAPSNECWLDDHISWARLKQELPTFGNAAPLPPFPRQHST